MLDILYILLVVVFIALSAAMIYGLEKLKE
jgi:hypothetical protein